MASMLRSLIKSGLEHTLALLPPKVTAGDRLILAYHNVVPDDTGTLGDASLHLPLSAFEYQMRKIAQDADVVSLATLLEQTPISGRPRDRLIAVTFDDAYRSAMKLAIPVCSSLQIPSTVFVSPGLLGTVPVWDRRADAGQWSESDRNDFLWRYAGRPGASESEELPQHLEAARIATQAELETIARDCRGLSIGNHTATHANLGALSEADAIGEIRAAHEWITGLFEDQAIPVIAYPFGIPPGSAAGVLASSGMSHGLLVSGRWMKRAGDERMLDGTAIPRWNIAAGLSDAGFVVGLRGRALS